ncbi:hypothetical protein PFISCL1PPCAC_3994, partial [Pristionchus fissidentatus]
PNRCRFSHRCFKLHTTAHSSLNDMSTRNRSKSPVELRRSPRKKAWASPLKTPTRNALANSNLFNDSDFSPLNESWADITEKDEECTARLLSTAERSKRKANSPKRVITKPKFVRSLELEKGISSSGRRSGDRHQETRGRQEERSAPRSQASRKRHLSNTSTVVDGGDDGASPRKRAAPSSSGRPARKNMKPEGTPSPARSRLFSAKSMSSPATGDFRPKEFYEEPTLGWCKDEKTIEKRNKEIEKAKQKPVYSQYLKEVAIAERIKGVHPRTPNKLINYSRRSWDSQVKSWKRSLYMWAGEEPSESANTSFYSETSEEQQQPMQEQDDDKPILAKLKFEDIHDTGVTTLMGRFDTSDESTLKATSATVDGPVTFPGDL